MTREERLNWLEQIEKDIHVNSLESTLADDMKSCAIHSVIESLKAEPCEDAVSREAVKKLYCNICMDKNICYRNKENCQELDLFDKLPSVTPKPRTEKWIKTPKAVMGEGYMWYCNKCEHQVYQDSPRNYPSEKYCPNCGAKMESEDKE